MDPDTGEEAKAELSVILIIAENVMKIPRCGVVDKGMATGNELTDVELKEEEELLRRHKRYALHGSRWKTKTLTYKVSR